jgi:cell division protein FtsW
MAVMLVLLVVVLIPHVGAQHFGAQRWFQVGPLSVQPSAIAVGVAIVFFSRWLTDREGVVRSFRGVRDYMIVLVVLLGLVLAERDFGSSIVIAATALILLALAGARKRHLLLIVIGFGATSAALVGLVAYRADRLVHFLNPCAAALGSGFQNCQALYAFGSGGIFGVGLGNSVQKYEWLPEAHTDFIFAIIGEELGLVGTLCVTFLYGGLAFAGLRIARRVPDVFCRLAATAITAWIVVQAAVNIGAVIGAMPITGVPLPLVSAGLSSLLVTLIALGMLMSFARLEPGAREALAARGPGWPLRVLSWLGLSKRRR